MKARARSGDEAIEQPLPKDQLPGERGVARLWSPSPMQTRAAHAMAIALMLAVGTGMLGWYYHTALAGSRAIVQGHTTPVGGPGNAETPLPPLEPDATPVRAGESPSPPPWFAQPPIAAATEAAAMAEATGGAPQAMPIAAPAEQSAERRWSGPVFASGSAAASVAPVSAEPASELPGSAAAVPIGETVASVTRLPTRRLLLAKGTFIDCTLETAIDSTLPGMATCVTATDTFGADGTVVLLERGTRLIGEVRGQVQQGAARVFVLWNEARTPTGVVVPLVSPGADELGRAGLPGHVNHHFWERFGAAILISSLNGAIQSATSAGARGGGAIVYSPQTSQDVLTEVLKSTIGIAPTVEIGQGARIQVLVARDLDFRTVYELRSLSGGR